MLIRKIKFPLIVSLFVVIIGCSYYYADHRITREANLGTFNYHVYENAKDLYNDSELIILATATKDSKEYVNEDEYVDGYTLTNVDIMEIIKDESNNEANKDFVTIIEPTFSIDNGLRNLGRTQFYSEDYRKVVPGAKYLFFLNWDEKKNAYWVHALHQGKINVDGKDFKENEVLSHNEIFRKLKDDVIQNYYTD